MQSIVLLICTHKDAPCYLTYSVKKDPEFPVVFKDKVYIHSNGKMNACLQLAKIKPEAILSHGLKKHPKRTKHFSHKMELMRSG